MFTVWYKELDRRGWMTGRQVEEHTGWMAGRYRVDDPGARRTQRLRTEGNMEHKMYLEMQKSKNLPLWLKRQSCDEVVKNQGSSRAR